MRLAAAVMLGAFAAFGVLADRASAQYMFLDTNGDGQSTAADTLNAIGATTLDIWLWTDTNRNGSQAVCGGGGGAPPMAAQSPTVPTSPATAMSVVSYEFILHANGGTINWGTYVNHMTSMTTTFGLATSPTEYRNGYGGASALSPGTYKIGTLQLTVASGQPSLSVASGTPLNATYITAFGSACAGADGDNTLKLGSDWIDADGANASSLVKVWSDGFECGALNCDPNRNWITYDYQPAGGEDKWAARAWPCSDPRTGLFSASGAGDSDRPCGQYDVYQGSDLYPEYAFLMRDYTSHFIGFGANYNLGSGDSIRVWRYNYPTAEWYVLKSFGGSSGGWIYWQTAIISNSSHQADTLAFLFEFTSDGDSNTNGWAYIDDVDVYGNPFVRPNLTAFTPDGWDGPIVVSSQPFTHTTSTLTAGQTAYVDWAWRNSGNDPASGFNMRYIVGSSVDARTFTSVAAGEEVKLEDYPVFITTSGNKTLTIDLDYLGDVQESNELDNTFPQTFYWNPPGTPDLFLPLPIAVDNAYPSLGDSITVTVKVKNGGNVSTNGFLVGLYKNRSSVPTTNDPADVSKPVGLLGPGGETTVTFKVANGIVALWQTYVLLDATGIVGESAEGNNVGGPLSINWQAGVFTVRGRFAYDDSLHGWAETYTECAVVEVWHDDTVDSLLATGVLGADGSFQLGPITNLDATPPAGGDAILDVFVRWGHRAHERCWDPSYADQWAVVMKVGGSEQIWSYNTPTVTNMANATYDFGMRKPTTYEGRSAAHIFDTVRRAWVYFGHQFRSQYGSPGPVNVRWVPGYTFVSSYDPPTATIRINGQANKEGFQPDEWDRYVIAHEYGHHVLWTLGGFSMPTDSIASPNIMTDPSRSLRNAWDEGWASFIGGGIGLVSPLGDNYGRDPNGTLRHYTLDLERGSVSIYDSTGAAEGPPFDRNEAGPLNQIAIGATLWDLQDNVPDNPDGDAFGDSLFGGYGTVLEAVLRYNVGTIRTICDFESWYLSLWCCDPDWRLKSQGVFREHAMFCGVGNVPVGVQVSVAGPTHLILHQNTPNPFNPRTIFRYTLPGGDGPEHVSLRIYDVRGRMVRELVNQESPGGIYEVPWDGTTRSGSTAGAGVYWCRLTYGGQQRTVRATLLR